MQSLRGIWVIKLTNIAASTFASDITNSFIDSSFLIILRKYKLKECIQLKCTLFVSFIKMSYSLSSVILGLFSFSLAGIWKIIR